MMWSSWWFRTLGGLSVLALVAAGCSDGDPEASSADGPAASEVGSDGETAVADEPSEPAAPDAEGSRDEGVSEGSGEEEATQPAEPGSVTAYVVGYHWGWAIFDDEGDELEVLEVPVGTEVELIAVNDHASHAIEELPDPIAEAIGSMDWHERALGDLEKGHPEGLEDELDQAGMSLSEAIMIAHDGGAETEPTPDHELMVTGLGVDAFLDAHADEPERLVFTVDEEGDHEFRCLSDCGVGHDNQRRSMLVVTA